MDPSAARWRRPRPQDIAVLGVSLLLATATTLLAHEEDELLLWLAAVYVYTAAGFLLLSGQRIRRATRDELARLGRGEPHEVVTARAVREERRRLAVDIRTVLQETLAEVHTASTRVLAAPHLHDVELPRLRERTQLATSELRRLLGILRVAEDSPDPGPPPGGAGHDERQPGGDGRQPGAARPRPPRGDLLQAGVLAALALAECWLNQRHREGVLDPAVMVTTVLAAAAFAGRTVAPVLTAVVQSLIFAVSFWAAAPVMSGVWLVRGVGAVVWANMAAAPRVREVAAALLLSATVLATRGSEPLLGVIASNGVVLVALLGGLVAGRDRRRQESVAARALAQRRGAEEAVRRAVTAERVRVARELHDVISHGVGLIAVQLNVLDVAKDDTERTRALRNINSTSASALRELDDVNTFPDSPGARGPRTWQEIEALVDRVRAAGAQVDLTVTGRPPEEHLPVTYRILQESLTNTMQHAGGARVRIRLDHTTEGTRITVVDDGPGPTEVRQHRFGLVGLTERIALEGGTLESGAAGPEGGFCLRAVLPARTSVPTRVATTVPTTARLTAGGEGHG